MEENMQRESTELSPFQERVNVNLFFSGGQRRKLLEEMKKAIFDSVPVITLTGDEGSGKTMMCRMMEKELLDEYLCVYLPNTLESFDDVVRVLAMELGTKSSKKTENTQDLVFEIENYLRENNRRLVAVFDQSERMYLATLERIRKMLDQINHSGVLFQILLVGRDFLLENLKQLAICDFENIEERRYILEPLGLSETYAYLNHNVKQRSSAKEKNVFSPEAAKKIYSMAQGNFRQINRLAEKSLESFDPETSFMVLLDNVYEDGSKSARKIEKRGVLFRLPFSSTKWMAGAAVLCVILVVSLFYRGGEEVQPPVVSEQTQKQEGVVEQALVTDTESDKATTKNPEPVVNSKEHDQAEKKEVDSSVTVKPQGETAPKNPEKKENGEESGEKVILIDPLKINDKGELLIPAEQLLTSEEEGGQDKAEDGVEDTVKDQEDKKRIAVTLVEDVASETKADPVEKSSETVADHSEGEKTSDTIDTIFEKTDKSPEEPEEVQDSTEKTDALPLPETMVEKKNDEPDLLDESVTTVTDEQSEETEINIDTDSILENDEQSSSESDEDVVTITANNKRVPPVKEEEDQPKKIVKMAPVTVRLPSTELTDYSARQVDTKAIDMMYEQRVAAASHWLAGESNDKHTVQLMMLASEQAEENLKKRFGQEDYQQVIDKLYIIEGTGDSSVFVFYGEYPDPDSARKVRNTLPIFLRKHNPYILSVESAVKKTSSK